MTEDSKRLTEDSKDRGARNMHTHAGESNESQAAGPLNNFFAARLNNFLAARLNNFFAARLNNFLASLGLLTVIPVGSRAVHSEAELQKSIPAFPLVGLLLGALLAASAYASSWLFSSSLSAALVVLAGALLTGGLHLDGLSDTFDGIAKRGDSASRLAVMKGGASGPAGVTATVLVLLIKYLAITELLAYTGYPLLLAAMPVASRWAAVAAMYHGRAARPDGLGRIFIGRISNKAFIASTALAFVIIIALVFGGLGRMSLGFMPLGLTLQALMFLVCGAGILYVCTILLVRLFKSMFGGLTGDGVGAVIELSEIIYLMVVLAWLRLFI